MEEKILSLDNPNYFDVEATPKSPESPSKGFFLFRKRQSGHKVSPKPKIVGQNNNLELASIGKRRGSLKCLLRSRSNSSGSPASPTAIGVGNVNRQSSTLDYKNTETKRFRERLGSYNESTGYAGNDDVFYSPTNESRFNYNVSQSQYSNSINESTVSGGARRHSIGTFMNKEKLRTSSITDEVPKMPAPRAPTTTLRNRDCTKIGESLASMDDILIVTARQSEPGILWVNYLKTCFDKITKQRGRLPFNFLHLKIDDDQITPQLIQRCLSTKLQIVVICPQFLSLPNHFLMSHLSSILKPERVLGMLLEVTEERVWEIHKNTLPSYKQWRRCTVRPQDNSSVSELLGNATDILGRALRQQPLCTATTPTPTKTTPSSHDSFTIFPRKVKVGQNKVILILSEPLVKDDWIKIKVEKTGQTLEITNIKRRNPFTIQFIIPETCMEVSMMIGIRVEKNNVDIGMRPLKCESRLRELEQILKSQDAPMEFMCQSIGIASSDREKLDLYLVQSFQKNIPPNFNLLNSVEQNNGFRLHREANPEEYPTLLHFAAKWGLERLCLQLLDCPGGDVACEMRNISGKTPAELADTSGHYKLALSFKNFSQMNEFTTMYHYFKGISDSSPNKTVIEPKPSSSRQLKEAIIMPESPIAEKVVRPDHTENEGYMEMNGSGSDINESGTNMTESINSVSNLNYLNIDSSSKDEVDCVADQQEKDQEIINNLNNSEEPEVMFNELRITEPVYFESNELNKTDEFSQECSNLLENCSAESDYLLQPSNVPVQSQDFGDYLTHPSNIPVDSKHTYNNINFGDYQNAPSNKKINVEQEASHLRMSFKKKDDDSRSKTGTLKRQGSTTSKKSVDDELLEIITDFKNNVFTIQEVEQLVASWKNRNDVKKSFKDKQEQLQKMREEYERIQQQMKESLRRPTPFERMKKLFTRNKTQQSKESKTLPELSDVCDEIKFSMLHQSSHRPMSTLSLHSVSSGSSGRMSTGSVCSGASLGDSGTHSDHEDRRHVYGTSVCRVGHPGSLMDNYMIPPAPRPVLTPASTPGEDKDRPPFPHHQHNHHTRVSTPTESSEHYILFPSNIPVEQINNDYINMPSTLKTIDETKETDNVTTVPSVPIKIQKKEIIYSQLERRTSPMSSFKSNNQSPTIEKSEEIQNNILLLNKTIKECTDSFNELQNIQPQ